MTVDKAMLERATEALNRYDGPGVPNVYLRHADLRALLALVTPLVERDAGLVERVARVIDPSSWRVFDGYLDDVKRKYKGDDAAYDPSAFKDKGSMAKANAAITAILEGK